MAPGGPVTPLLELAVLSLRHSMAGFYYTLQGVPFGKPKRLNLEGSRGVADGES
jgi:hypothetical protein